jgi:hypothetical protein
MAEWLCFEPVTGRSGAAKGGFRPMIEACSQGLGSMITEPRMDGQRTPLQDFETLYIGEAEPAVVRRAFVGYDLAESRLGRFKTWPNQDYARLRRKFNDHDGS